MLPFLDLSRQATHERDALLGAMSRVLASGRFVLGVELEAFEAEFAAFTGQRHCVGLSSGAAALALSLRAIGVGPGDEVIVPAFTAVPSVAAICNVGAVPVFVDVLAGSATIDPEAAGRAMSGRTRAVMPVHLFGRPSDVPALGVPVVEDAAQAHGAVRGSRSAAIAYSFYPTKNLGGLGDGGAVVTNDDAVASELRLLRSHGFGPRDDCIRIAMNARMSELEAAVLRLRLGALESGNAMRRSIAGRYRKASPHLTWQETHPDHVYHLCVFRVEDRAAFRSTLGVASEVHYSKAVYEHPAYRSFAPDPCVESEAWARECVSVPCNPFMSEPEIDEVTAALASAAQ